MYTLFSEMLLIMQIMILINQLLNVDTVKPGQYNTMKTNQYVGLDRGRRGLDRMIIGFRTTYVISAYHH